MNIDFKKITRLEVIDEKGRSYSRWDIQVYGEEHMLQDNGRTLKIFITPLQLKPKFEKELVKRN